MLGGQADRLLDLGLMETVWNILYVSQLSTHIYTASSHIHTALHTHCSTYTLVHAASSECSTYTALRPCICSELIPDTDKRQTVLLSATMPEKVPTYGMLQITEHTCISCCRLLSTFASDAADCVTSLRQMLQITEHTHISCCKL